MEGEAGCMAGEGGAQEALESWGVDDMIDEGCEEGLSFSPSEFGEQAPEEQSSLCQVSSNMGTSAMGDGVLDS